ncbi:MAG: NAD(P)-dependent alcohol dehydrogenase [Actinomycetia bacterium]|nr:NAD(P)-dependent alcohol dehydrogenase [Actinomycetes bacterium]
MKAVQYRKVGANPEVVEIDTPTPGPGQVLLKVTAAGLCHSDIFVMSLPEEAYTYGLPLTLGHEGVGVIVDAGEAAKHSVSIGESVMVYGPWGCGRCRQCAEGYENYCTEAARLGIRPPGLGAPGAAAEYMIVDDPRHCVPIGDLDPVTAAPITDAGLTPYHAVKRSIDKLGANSTAVVLGVGGLGHVAIQLIKHLTSADVIALDTVPDHLDLARSVGADHALASNQDAVAAVKDLTHGLGADVVFDFVGITPTIALGAQMCKVRGDWDIVGVGDGVAQVGFFKVPYACRVSTSYWGTRTDLVELVELAQRGVLTVHTETYTLDQAPVAYQKLRDHQVRGRAVLVP